MLEYPQRFGPSLADDIRLWGERWVEQAWGRVGHLYPPIGGATDDDGSDDSDGALFADERSLFADVGGSPTTTAAKRAAGRPIAYLWTRTVQCPNPAPGVHQRRSYVRPGWQRRRVGSSHCDRMSTARR